MFLQQNSLDIVNAVSNENLFENLINQINKDFHLANIDVSFNIENPVELLLEKLQLEISNLFYNSYDSYLNLVYRVDVSEKEMVKIECDSDIFIEQITFLILKREAQKVWFKSKF